MIDSNSYIQPIKNVYMNNIDQPVQKDSTVPKKEEAQDKIELSNESQEFAPYLNELRNMPEVSIDTVSKYHDLINSHQYNIDAKQISEKILNNTLL